jgi:hypothetical protein
MALFLVAAADTFRSSMKKQENVQYMEKRKTALLRDGNPTNCKNEPKHLPQKEQQQIKYATTTILPLLP